MVSIHYCCILVLVKKTVTTGSADETKLIGKKIGAAVKGGEVFVLDSDLGGGKTTFTKGVAESMGVEEIVHSPTFTLEQVYPAKNGLFLHHYDFYRLQDPGVLADQLDESLQDKKVVVVIEWSGIVEDHIKNAIRINFKNDPGKSDVREISINAPENKKYLLEEIL